MDRLDNIFTSVSERKSIKALIETSPSPSLAVNNLARLIEAGGRKALDRIPREDLFTLVRLLGSSTFLSDTLVRQGKNWPEVFLLQVRIAQKTTAQHLAELESLLTTGESFNEFCAGLRQHKQREYLRIGTRDLLSSVSL